MRIPDFLSKTLIASIGILLIFAFLKGCTTTGTVQPKSEPTAIVAEGSNPEVTASIKRGRILATTECMECHRYYRPNEYSKKDWIPIVVKMGKRASLSGKQINDLQRFFQTNSQQKNN